MSWDPDEKHHGRYVYWSLLALGIMWTFLIGAWFLFMNPDRDSVRAKLQSKTMSDTGWVYEASGQDRRMKSGLGQAIQLSVTFAAYCFVGILFVIATGYCEWRAARCKPKYLE